MSQNSTQKANIIAKAKNAMNSATPIYEDPRYKDFEGKSLEKFKMEKEKSLKEYNQLKKELEILKEEYEKTKIRTKERENELRRHINNLLIKYRTKDPDQNLKNIKELNEQIVSNIKTLEDQSKQDIKEKKKDMETRIKLRLVDSEINYNKELDKKVKEQQEILKTLHEFTQDMEKIKKNYNSIKEKADHYLRENEKYREDIKKYEDKNDELKNEIMKLKHLNNKMSIKLMSNDTNDINNSNNNKDNKNQILDFNINNEDLNNIQKEIKISPEKNKNQKIKLKADTFTVKDIINVKNQAYNNISIDRIVDLLSDENYVNQHYRECSVIASLLNIYEKTNKKINSLNNEYVKLLDHHPIYDRIIKLIQELKSKEINSKIKNISKLSRRVVNEILGNYIITMKKEQRKELIQIITEDEEITNFIHQDKLPNIMNRDRQIKIA